MHLPSSKGTYKRLLIPLSFILTLLVTYVIDPQSFQEAWKGRVFYLFFLWLFALEFITGDRSSKLENSSDLKWARIISGAFMLIIPTIYTIEAHVFGLNNTIIEFGKTLGIGQGLRDLNFQRWLVNYSWPLSVEYIVVAVSIFMAIFFLLEYEGLKQFSVSVFLLVAMSIFYTIDTFRPYGTFTFSVFPSFPPFLIYKDFSPLQGLVPFTTSFVTSILPQIGYSVQTIVLQQTGSVQMLVNGVPFLIYWPCAGIHSLFIYTFVILLFLKGSQVSLAEKITCLVVGAVGTFFVNVLRIVSIIDVFLTSGAEAGTYFHNYYGELFFLGWIVIYLFALIFVQRFLTNARNRTYAAISLAAVGVGILISTRFFSYPLVSAQLILSIAGLIFIIASLVLLFYTCFALYYEKRLEIRS